MRRDVRRTWSSTQTCRDLDLIGCEGALRSAFRVSGSKKPRIAAGVSRRFLFLSEAYFFFFLAVFFAAFFFIGMV